MVARNASGEELNAWAKGYISSEPLQAETYVVLWALNLAKAIIIIFWCKGKLIHWLETRLQKQPHHHRIIVEGDAKLCFDVHMMSPPLYGLYLH